MSSRSTRSSRPRGGAARCSRKSDRRGWMKVEFPTDLEIARKARLLPMPEIAGKMGIDPHLLEPYGHDVAKIKLDAIEELSGKPRAKYVVVSAITPTPLGEGKTTTTVGLGDALGLIGKRATVAIRQPSMGPTFGIKGGAAGGGYSQVVPMERLNLHLTGDFHAVTAAHNLLAAMIDNYIHHSLRDFPIDLHSITWRRVLDVSDRVLRSVDAGLGADMGAERFFNIKCRTSGLAPDAAVIVATVRALKVHSGKYRVVAGRPLPPDLIRENPDDVLAGAANLRKQVENIQIHGVTPVVAINAFPDDHPSEHRAIRELAEHLGVRSAVCNNFAEGGAGATELAEMVAEAADEPSVFQLLYPDAATLREKIETIALRIYGARGVEYDPPAAKQLDAYEASGFGRLPVCIAKTHLSISSDPKLKGAPTGWVLPVREVRASVGAGFIYPICGEMRTMPGLPTTPIAASIDIDEEGEIVGLS